ncbi:MAG: hypothetical protein A3E78_02115 [Alphaproteobacteria bacterium RIFCSPHIGHO2_12_FULL_63_12]|nr:MAG: hypothetical protein A3E78_02115 [Alphaproteobacteria bacterium RIFCSPHIGHO2_12_FULL_63_12]
MREENDGSPATAFDALIEKMKSDLARDDAADDRAAHVSKLRSIFDAALADIESKGAEAASHAREGAQKVSEQMKSHPVSTISGAFAAGYFVGRAIAGRARK